MKHFLTFCMALCASTALWAGNFTPAAFSIAEGKQVYFSPGNLQCSGVTTEIYVWSFAENQYDMIGEANVSGSALADKIDLFGWSTTASAKWGISTSTNYDDYAGDFVDWGTNIIGTNAANTYRTLTKEEWDYLLDTRTNAGDKKGVARITLSEAEYANGLILLPDIWNCPEGIEFKSGFEDEYSIDAYATHQTFTIAQWKELEAAGAVFLPASGYREWSNVGEVQSGGTCWSATPAGYYDACGLNCYSESAGVYSGRSRYGGRAVRLVQDIKYAVTITESVNGTVETDKIEAPEGKIVTLIVTPADDYELATLTVKDASENTITVTDNKFVMPASAVTVTATFKRPDTKEYVDLGLPSGLLWATCNVGAYSPEIYGNYYAWGETTTKETYSWYTYKYGTYNYDGDYSKLTKYNTDDLTTLEAADDAATANWGGKWRMPTSAEWAELIDNCEWTWTDDYNGTGVAGRIVTSKTNGNTIFLPAAGCRYDGVLSSAGYGYYFSSSLRTDSPHDALYAYFYSDNVYGSYNGRFIGHSIRPVQDVVYAVNIAATTNGTVEADKIEAPAGKIVTLTVTPDPGYELATLTVKDAGENTITVTDNTFVMPASAVTVTATFKKTDYTITIAEGIVNGEVTAVSTANYGDEVELTIAPATGYELDVLTVKNTDNQEVEVTDNKFTMPASTVTVTATFKKTDYAITIAEDIENGKVTAVSTANYGDEVELTLAPATGYELDVLTVKDAVEKEITVIDNKFTMPASTVTVTATFKKTDYTITIEASVNGEVSAVSTANYGDEVELTITPATGYELATLTVKDAENSDIDVVDNKFVMPASAVTVTATFKKTDYTITIEASENGKVTAVSTANYGDEVELTVTPATGYELDVLTVKDAGDNEIKVTDNKFTMPASTVTVTATFKKTDYTITIAEDITNGTVSVTSGATTANYGDEVELTIAPATGYELEALTVKDAEEKEITVTNNKFTMPTSAVTVTATFKKTDYTITIAEDIENGKVTAVSTANYGDEVELTIAPATGYELDVLTVKDAGDNEIKVTDNKFTMPASAVTVSAIFTPTHTALETIETIELRTENGSIIYDGEFQIFDLLGRNVTRLNGSLNGVYIVKVGDKAQKIVVSRK